MSSCTLSKIAVTVRAHDVVIGAIVRLALNDFGDVLFRGTHVTSVAHNSGYPADHKSQYRGELMTMKTRQLVPMVFVKDVERSVGFYRHLGFEVGNTFTQEGATAPAWAWLSSGQAQLMLAAAGADEIVADQQRVLFYVYTDDVPAAQASLAEKGLSPGEISTPFYAPRGEFKLVDPDGYTLMITHT